MSFSFIDADNTEDAAASFMAELSRLQDRAQRAQHRSTTLQQSKVDIQNTLSERTEACVAATLRCLEVETALVRAQDGISKLASTAAAQKKDIAATKALHNQLILLRNSLAAASGHCVTPLDNSSEDLTPAPAEGGVRASWDALCALPDSLVSAFLAPLSATVTKLISLSNSANPHGSAAAATTTNMSDVQSALSYVGVELSCEESEIIELLMSRMSNVALAQ